jgi:energy-coupling factor transporter ATP-binding protein EcfA2
MEATQKQVGIAFQFPDFNVFFDGVEDQIPSDA